MTKHKLLYLVRETAINVIDLIDEHLYLLQENKRLEKQLKEYQDMIFNRQSVHPAEAMLALIQEGHLSLHEKKNK